MDSHWSDLQRIVTDGDEIFVVLDRGTRFMLIEDYAQDGGRSFSAVEMDREVHEMPSLNNAEIQAIYG